MLGLKVFDDLLNLREYTVLVYGPLGSGKSLLVRRLSEEARRQGRDVIYLALEEDPRRVKESFKKRGVEGVKIVNYYVDSIKDPEIVQGYEMLSDLRTLLSSRFPLIILDSLNEVTLKYDVNQIVQLIKGISALTFDYKGLTIVTYNSVADEVDVSLQLVKYLFDGVIALNVEPIPNAVIRSFRVERLKGVRVDSGWNFFAINDRGEFESVDASAIVSLMRNMQSQ